VSSLLEDSSGLGTYEHHSLLLADEPSLLALLRFNQTLTLALQMEILKSSDHIIWETSERRAPEICIVQGGERCDCSNEADLRLAARRDCGHVRHGE
jgi:hypothetical protein